VLDQSEWIYGYKFKELDDGHNISYLDLHEVDYIRNVFKSCYDPDYSDVPCTLVTHNSDYSVSMAMPKDIEIPPNLLWYSVNVDVAHPQIRSIPIGLENPHWHPKKTEILKSTIEAQYDRKIRCNAIFNCGTNPSRRKIMANFYNMGFHCTESLNGYNYEYFAAVVAISDLTVCPRGNGIDTHRIWEALYLGSIPLVQDGLNEFSLSLELPLVLVDLEKIGFEELEMTINSYMKTGLLNDKRALKMSYWIDKIRNRK